MGVGPVGFSVEQQNLLWAMWRRGDSIREMERALGETLPRIRRFLRQSGGIPPVPRRRRASHLTLVEREEISRGITAGLTARSIAGRIGRPSSTVSREIVRNVTRALPEDAATPWSQTMTELVGDSGSMVLELVGSPFHTDAPACTRSAP